MDIIKTIFRHEENVAKFNAIITIPNLNKGNNYSYKYDNIEWFCKSFGEYIYNKEYKIPDVLYYLDRHILLMVFWLDQVPSNKNIENANEFMIYLKNNLPKWCKTNEGEIYISKKFNDSHIMDDAEIKSVFMLPVELKNKNDGICENLKNQIVYYSFKEVTGNQKSIHCNIMETDKANKKIEVEFFEDNYKYFIVTKLPEVLVADNYLMKRASLRDICTNRISTYDPGIYMLIYKGEIKKVGKAELGIYQRVCDYYFKDKRENNSTIKANNFINENNKDEIEVGWMTYTKELCADKEKEVQMILDNLGIQREWDGRNEFNNRNWLIKRYEKDWKYKIDKLHELGIVHKIINQNNSENTQDALLKINEIRYNVDKLKIDIKETRKIAEKNSKNIEFLCNVIEDLNI